jgi:hypothetical protein
MAQVLLTATHDVPPSPFELATAMSGVVQESDLAFLTTQTSGISMADEEYGAVATEQLPAGCSNAVHAAAAEPLEPVTSGTTTEGEDELMRQLSASLSTLGIDMKPVGVSLELQEQSLLLPPHPSGECLLPTCPTEGDQAVGVVYDESMKLHIGPAGMGSGTMPG